MKGSVRWRVGSRLTGETLHSRQSPGETFLGLLFGKAMLSGTWSFVCLVRPRPHRTWCSDVLLPEGCSPTLEARLRRAEQEVEYLAPALQGTTNLLDIGCGPAITSVLLYERLGPKLRHLFLMDGGPKRMREESWFDGAPKPWADMDLARAIVKLNDVNAHLMEPDPDFTYDLVDGIISLLSWGHHYPVHVYLPLARRTLPLGGKIVLDLRKGKCGAATLLSGGFRMVALLDETEKTSRYCFERIRL